MTTPFPFPLVQMARTFLFFYIYTLPFALLNDASNPLAHLGVIFMVRIDYYLEVLFAWCWPFRLSLTSLLLHHRHHRHQVTYGFVGLETVSIELDDPFGDDENDFDNLGMALVSNNSLLLCNKHGM
jgi:predicted membrane chloride channel (bestrophin family)